MLLGLLSACNHSNREVADSAKIKQMDELILEPVGGVADTGPSGHIKSEGRIAITALSPEDRARVEALFSHAQTAPGNFYYRLTRSGPGGTKSINVPPEAVPAALVATVKTVLK
jgi:hypothetical protein